MDIEKQEWVPVILKRDNQILLKWNSYWEDYNFLGGKVKENKSSKNNSDEITNENTRIKKTLIDKITKELGLTINEDYTYKILTDKFRFRKKSERRNQDCYYICYPYLLMCLKRWEAHKGEVNSIKTKIEDKNVELLKELKNKYIFIINTENITKLSEDARKKFDNFIWKDIKFSEKDLQRKLEEAGFKEAEIPEIIERCADKKPATLPPKDSQGKRHILSWFNVEELTNNKKGKVTSSIGDIFWNINKKDDSPEELIKKVLNDIPDSFNDILIKLREKKIIIGKNPRSLEMVDKIKEAVEDTFEKPVMLLGDMGTGKSNLAEVIHELTRGAKKNPVEENTEVIHELTRVTKKNPIEENKGKRHLHEFVSDTLSGITNVNFQCLVFGYAPCSFTGASPKGQHGLFWKAHKGTVFLDEVTTIDDTAQAIFLKTLGVKFLESPTKLSFYRYGGAGSEEKEESDVRIISATNKVPVQKDNNQISFSEFRDDLTSRLASNVIRLPSLIELKEDWEFIVESFLKEFASGKDSKERILNKCKILNKISATMPEPDISLTINKKVINEIFSGKYDLSANYRSLLALLAGIIDKAIKDCYLENNTVKIQIEERHLPFYGERD